MALVSLNWNLYPLLISPSMADAFNGLFVLSREPEKSSPPRVPWNEAGKNDKASWPCLEFQLLPEGLESKRWREERPGSDVHFGSLLVQKLTGA